MQFKDEFEAQSALGHIQTLAASTSFEWFMFHLYNDMETKAEALISENRDDIRLRQLQGEVRARREINEKLDKIQAEALEYLNNSI